MDDLRVFVLMKYRPGTLIFRGRVQCTRLRPPTHPSYQGRSLIKINGSEASRVLRSATVLLRELRRIYLSLLLVCY